MNLDIWGTILVALSAIAVLVYVAPRLFDPRRYGPAVARLWRAYMVSAGAFVVIVLALALVFDVKTKLATFVLPVVALPALWFRVRFHHALWEQQERDGDFSPPDRE